MAATNPGPTLRNPPRRRLRLLMNAAAGAYADWPSLSTAALAITGLAIFFFLKSSVSGQKDSRRPTSRFLSADLNILLPTSDLVTWKLTWVLLSAVFHLLKARYGARYHLKEMEFLEKIQGQYNDAQFWSSHLIERFNKFPSSTSKSESWFGSLGCLWDPNLFSSDCPLNFLSRGCFYYI